MENKKINVVVIDDEREILSSIERFLVKMIMVLKLMKTL